MIRRVTIEALAPTGEGVARTPDGVGFVAGALPGEEVDAEVAQTRKRFWKGRAVGILRASAERAAGEHAQGCPGCDWAHLPLDHARQWKRTLFLETMERIGELPREPFGELPIAPSPPGYRLRARFHVMGIGSSAAVGFFAPRTHRVQPAEGCEALGDGMRALLPRLSEAVASSGAPVSQIETVEAFDATKRLARATLAPQADRSDASRLLERLGPLFDGVAAAGGRGEILGRLGEPRLWLTVGRRAFPVAAGTFFQVNRHLVGELYGDVAREAGALPAGRGLDAFGGVGLLAGSILDAGHEVVSVEADHEAVELAEEAKRSAGEPRWRIARSAVLPFLDSETGRFDVAVVDPPRSGLGLPLAARLPDRIAGRLLYVSCDPATLARDLAALQSRGLRIVGARLYDFFAFTHRVEALVLLDRAGTR